MTSPQPSDLDAIEAEFLRECGPHDISEIATSCACRRTDPRWAIHDLVAEVRALRAAAGVAVIEALPGQLDRLLRDIGQVQKYVKLTFGLHRDDEKKLDYIANQARDSLALLVQMRAASARSITESTEEPTSA